MPNIYEQIENLFRNAMDEFNKEGGINPLSIRLHIRVYSCKGDSNDGSLCVEIEGTKRIVSGGFVK